jgi:hypothetical protein
MISKTAKRFATVLVALAMVEAPLTACSSDENTSTDGGTGGSGTGGKAAGGSAGKGTGGAGGKGTGGNGGNTTGGNGGTAGKGPGGTGGKQHLDGGPDGDAGCVSPQGLFYTKAGCNGTVAPVCAGPTFDACSIEACSCDGETIGGCGFYEKPFAHLGACADSGRPDAGDAGGKDGGDAGH